MGGVTAVRVIGIVSQQPSTEEDENLALCIN